MSKVRHVLADAQGKTSEAIAELQRFEWFEANQVALSPPVLDMSPRGKAIREINRLSKWRGWQDEVEQVQDRYGVASPDGLSDDAVFELLERLRVLEDRLQWACDPDEAPPAR